MNDDFNNGYFWGVVVMTVVMIGIAFVMWLVK